MCGSTSCGARRPQPAGPREDDGLICGCSGGLGSSSGQARDKVGQGSGRVYCKRIATAYLEILDHTRQGFRESASAWACFRSGPPKRLGSLTFSDGWRVADLPSCRYRTGSIPAHPHPLIEALSCARWREPCFSEPASAGCEGGSGVHKFQQWGWSRNQEMPALKHRVSLFCDMLSGCGKTMKNRLTWLTFIFQRSRTARKSLNCLAAPAPYRPPPSLARTS